MLKPPSSLKHSYSILCPCGDGEWEDVSCDGEEHEEVDMDMQDSDNEESNPSICPYLNTIVAVNRFFKHKVAWCHFPKTLKAAVL